ncbi:MAG: chemotaxis protein CheD [Clostridium baratii]|uniref:Probable chemoreceptor glutamine deamidase CheD n=1 Tax=Clostridium baratii str. Sullivan TaxID=1415775 RepID=A0A0A7FUV2_9CLOT|nr:chemotaxis protein CheD [Clostridium baratii]AIY82720.1 cheD chemotactic sensory transduction family protein [Clostridium baratii str. Sullivan]MBS6006409.1 chemotaxis protein CheD [Clostridium baratii]CUO89263.1 protein CheD [Clostridium baratii]
MILKDKIVGLSEIYVGKEGENIITVGLGSCVGVIIYDDKNKVFGLAHIMLSDSTQFKNVQNIGKYVDLAIPELIRQVIKNGALRKNLKCKLTGGASMFNFSDTSLISDIGKRNVIKAREVLLKEKIEIISEDVFGTKGRTISINTSTGEIFVKMVGGETRVI